MKDNVALKNNKKFEEKKSFIMMKDKWRKNNTIIQVSYI